MDVSATINRIVTKTAKIDERKLVDHGTQFSDLELDSLTILEVVYEIEVEFGIELEENQLAGLKSVADLADAVSNQLNLVA